MPKVALVHDFLTAMGGAERVLQELHSMYPAAPIYTLLADPAITSRHFQDADIRVSGLERSWLRRRQHLLLPRLPQAIEEFDFSGFDVAISSSAAFAHGIITGPDTVHICYCHSPMRYAWDWHSEYLREHGISGGAPLMATSQLMNRIRTWDFVASKRVDRWLANSRTVQRRIEKFYRQPSEIVYPPVDTDFFAPMDAPTGGYAITVSRLSRYKRVELLIHGCHVAGTPLVVVGTGSERVNLQEYARQLGADVRFVSGASDQELKELLAGAACFVFAAEEDFGIAPVEAMSMGVPVVALAAGGALETVSDGVTGILYEQPDAQAIAEAVRHVGTVTGSPERIRQQAQRFSRQAFRTAISKQVGDA